MLFISTSSLADIKAEKVKNDQAILIFNEADHFKNFSSYILQSSKNEIEITVKKIINNKALVKINKGSLANGDFLTIKKRIPASKNMTSRLDTEMTDDTKFKIKNLSITPNLFFGSGTNASSSTYDGASTNNKSSINGIGISLNYDFIFNSIAVGPEYNFTTYTAESSSNITSHEFGLSVGWTEMDLKINVFGCLYLFGLMNANEAVAAGMNGFKVGLNYYLFDNISLLGAYKVVEFSSVKIGDSASAVSFSFQGVNLGASFHF